jgi:hypothetical protein
MNYKIEKNQLFVCDNNGFKLRLICDGVNYASYNDKEKTFLVTLLNGDVRTRDTNGNSIRLICENAIEARFVDDKIQVRRKDGRNELRDKHGNQIKWL